MTTFVYAPNAYDARRAAKEIGLAEGEWKFITGPDQIGVRSFHLVLGAPLTMGLDYAISVARASGGRVTLQEIWT